MSVVPQKKTMDWEVEDVTVTPHPTIKKAIAAAAIGNVTEWYDFGVYSYLALTIGEVFFPNLDGLIRGIITAALFAVAFIVRPIGGLVLGPASDRLGRNKVLAFTMIMMAAGTFLIGCLPGYGTVGLLAPFPLLACRLVQGFSTGGEYGNAMTFIAEYAPDRKRGFWGSLLEVGTFTGYLIGASVATIMAAVLSHDQLVSWGWRIPFFVALPLGLVGVYLRSKLGDTPAFEALEAEQTESGAEKKGVWQQIKDTFHLWPNMLVCAGLVIAWNVANYMLTSYMPAYFPVMAEIQGHGAVSQLTSQIMQIVVLAVCLALIPVIGYFSDKLGRKTIVYIGSAALVLLSWPSLMLIRADGEATTLLGLLIMGLSLICFSATMPSTLPSLFPTALRAGALSIAFNISISLFGGTTSTVMSGLVNTTHWLMWPAVYLMVTGLIGFVAIQFTPESNRKPLWGSNPSVGDHEDPQEHLDELTEIIEGDAKKAAAKA